MGEKEAPHSVNSGLQMNNDANNENDDDEPNLSNEIENYLNTLRQQGISIQISANVPLEQRQQLVSKLKSPLPDEPLYTQAELNLLLQQQQNVQEQYQSDVNSQGEFHLVQTKRKRTLARENINIGEHNYSSRYNKFDILRDSDEKMDDDSNTSAFKDLIITQLQNNYEKNIDIEKNILQESNSQRVTQQKRNNNNNQPTNKQQSNSKEQGNRARFCPPIILYNVDIREMVMQFKSKFPNIELKIVNSSKTKSKLYVKDFDTYTSIMALLKEKNISSHSFTPEQNKQFSVILRGLHYRCKPDEIKNELDILCPNVINNVQAFYTPFMRKNKVESSLFLVTLAPGQSVNGVTNIKYLLYQSVSWEKPKSYAKEVQCKRCQRWGHIAKNCNHSYNCVKCDKAHNPGECLLPKSEDVEPFCINCKKWGHPANFRGCEKFVQYSKVKAKVKSAGNFTNVSPNVNSSKSFSSLFRNDNSDNNKYNSSLMREFLLLADELLTDEPISIESKIKNFLVNFKSMTIADRKKECIKILHLIKNNNE